MKNPENSQRLTDVRDRTDTSKKTIDYATPKPDPFWFRVLVICGCILAALIIVGVVVDHIYNHYRYGKSFLPFL